MKFWINWPISLYKDEGGYRTFTLSLLTGVTGYYRCREYGSSWGIRLAVLGFVINLDH